MDIDKIKQIQSILGVDADGMWGPKSKAALDAVLGASPKTWHVGKASSFADPKDVESYIKWYKIYLDQGLSHDEAQRKAFAKGDNGEGCWGDNTKEGSGPSCAISREDMIEKWGTERGARMKPILVTANQASTTVLVKDRMPSEGHKLNPAIIDLNPDACKALGLTPPVMTSVSWKWA